MRAEHLLRTGCFVLDPRPFVLLGFAPGVDLSTLVSLEGGFLGLLVDDLETTVFLPRDSWSRLRPALARVPERTAEVRLFTFDHELPPDLVGFLASVSASLAAAGVPILPLAAARRDHLFVPATDVEAAAAALRKLGSVAEV